jgi:hypothetical protein
MARMAKAKTKATADPSTRFGAFHSPKFAQDDNFLVVRTSFIEMQTSDSPN